MMEPEDRVSSEITNFTQKEKCEDNFNALRSCDYSFDESDDEKYECFMGSDGQTILWCEESETVLSRFPFTYPSDFTQSNGPKSLKPKLDCDGDFDVVRKNKQMEKEGVVLIQHHPSTTLDLVGEQIWRGALFLGDYVLHHSKHFRHKHILEVASGVGFTSIIASMSAKQVVITDVDKGDIIDFVHRNLRRNKELIKAKTFVREINFYDTRTISDLDDLLSETSIILAADVIYHNQLTDAFFKSILFLMMRPPNKTLYVSLEKRYVFTIEDMDTVAPCYDHFLEGLKRLAKQETSTISWEIEEVEPDFPQYFTYERSRHLVIWKVTAKLL